jgi:hypothetical protein
MHVRLLLLHAYTLFRALTGNVCILHMLSPPTRGMLCRKAEALLLVPFRSRWTILQEEGVIQDKKISC